MVAADLPTQLEPSVAGGRAPGPTGAQKAASFTEAPCVRRDELDFPASRIVVEADIQEGSPGKAFSTNEKPLSGGIRARLKNTRPLRKKSADFRGLDPVCVFVRRLVAYLEVCGWQEESSSLAQESHEMILATRQGNLSQVLKHALSRFGELRSSRLEVFRAVEGLEVGELMKLLHRAYASDIYEPILEELLLFDTQRCTYFLASASHRQPALGPPPGLNASLALPALIQMPRMVMPVYMSVPMAVPMAAWPSMGDVAASRGAAWPLLAWQILASSRSS